MDIEELSTDPRVIVRPRVQPAHERTAVAYGMRRGQRAADTPALETVIAAANAVAKPVVIDSALVAGAVRAQTYLEPFPNGLMLRNHVSDA